MAQGEQTYTYRLDKEFFETMESSDIHGADLDARLTVTHKGDIYDLAFVIAGTVTLKCDRCLDDLIHPIEATYDIAVKYGDDYAETDDLLVIPEADQGVNVSYMMFDTVSLAIPLKHVHPMGKCNRAMSALLRKHRAVKEGDEDAELAGSLIDEMDSMPLDDTAADGDTVADTPTDPRWDRLKKLAGGGDDDTAATGGK